MVRKKPYTIFFCHRQLCHLIFSIAVQETGYRVIYVDWTGRVQGDLYSRLDRKELVVKTSVKHTSGNEAIFHQR